jgi:hypothetical protein
MLDKLQLFDKLQLAVSARDAQARDNDKLKLIEHLIA